VLELIDEIQKTNPASISKITLLRNEFLIQAGQVENHAYIVNEGSLRVFYLTEKEEHTIRFAYKGSFFTALDSFLSGNPTQYYIQALKKTELTVVEKTALKKTVYQNTALTKSYIETLENAFLQQMEREIDLLTNSPSERFNRILKRNPQVFNEIPHRHIAAYLRMTPETLSRLKKS
jgi:CRP-like cAMP-binding protein